MQPNSGKNLRKMICLKLFYVSCHCELRYSSVVARNRARCFFLVIFGFRSLYSFSLGLFGRKGGHFDPPPHAFFSENHAQEWNVRTWVAMKKSWRLVFVPSLPPQCLTVFFSQKWSQKRVVHFVAKKKINCFPPPGVTRLKDAICPPPTFPPLEPRRWLVNTSPMRMIAVVIWCCLFSISSWISLANWKWTVKLHARAGN